jgi:hypothetical protein
MRFIIYGVSLTVLLLLLLVLIYFNLASTPHFVSSLLPTATLDHATSSNHSRAPTNNTSSYVDSNTTAQLLALAETLQTFPVYIVGGLGDSGTRGVQELMAELGIFMLDGEDVNRAKDSMVFSHCRLDVPNRQVSMFMYRRVEWPTLIYLFLLHSA